MTKARISNEEFLIDSLKLLVDGIARTFGSRCEVVLHDLRSTKNLKHSIVKIANGHISGRKAGGSITDRGLRDLRSGLNEELIINYPSVTKDGRILKSSSFIFKDHDKKPIAAICINFDISDIKAFNALIQNIFEVSEEGGDKPNRLFETFQGDMVSTLNGMAEEAIRKAGKSVPALGKKDKIEIVKQLEAHGFFLIKGGIKLLASRLNVSKYTLYNYLEQVRSESQESKSSEK
jgi:predicted transcriptional regulator YheO